MGCPAVDQVASANAGLIATQHFLPVCEGWRNAELESLRVKVASQNTLQPCWVGWDDGLTLDQPQGLPGRWPSRMGRTLIDQRSPKTACC